jgi:multiple sugar transport system substrate-binding protein
VKYGVQILPGFNGDHETIAGPDMWCVFDNGNGRAQAALKFLSVLTSAEQVRKEALATGHLPIRLSVVNDASFLQQFGQAFPGVDVFAQNLANVKQARPVLAANPQVSEAMGNAIVAAMLGRSDPKTALDQAAAQANDALAQAG